VNVVREIVRLTPRAIREHLGLNRPIYKKTSAYGHFGRKPEDDGHFSWERLDLVAELKRHYNL
jgi:S-adenosylmethionine synthetase